MALVPASRQQDDDGFGDNDPFDTGVRVDRGTGFGMSRTGGRVRSRQPRRPNPPTQPDRRPIASPERQREAGENLVGAGLETGDANALLQAPIAGLTPGAVTQEGSRFKRVTDSTTGISVPDQGDPDTKAAFRRFFDTSFRPGVNSQIPSQRDRNADPTRAAFQSTFFPSETLSDLGIGKRKSFNFI